MKAGGYNIVAQSNGHSWIEQKYAGKKMECCLDCGITRRRDDKNSQCKGRVKVVVR